MAEVEKTLDALVARLNEHYRAGAYDEAFAIARETVSLYPRSSLARTNLGFLYIKRGAPARAREAYGAALRLNPRNAEARRGLAVAKTQCGEIAQGDSVSVVPYRGSGSPVDVLALITLGVGNVVLDALFDDRVFRLTKLAVELHPPDADLPLHDVAFNAIGEADAASHALSLAMGFLRRLNLPALNDPDAVLRTGREHIARRLGALEGVVTPCVERVSRAQLRDERHVYPLLLRSPGYHTGEHFVRVERVDELRAALDTLPGDELFKIEYVDTREPSGTFTKYRVMSIGGKLYPLHLAIGENWKVHYFSAAMHERSEYRWREERFLSNMEETLGGQAMAALLNIERALGLDYAGIDFALDAAGNVVLFEANATMAVRYPPNEPMWAYRRPAVEAVVGAVQAMMKKASQCARMS
jgi:tetratricopeptide (TPR) repeat protein